MLGTHCKVDHCLMWAEKSVHGDKMGRWENLVFGEVDDGVQVAEEGEEVGDEVGVDFRSSSTEIWRR